MSNRAVVVHTILWWVRPIDNNLQTDETEGHLFTGSLENMLEHINTIELETGKQQAAQQLKTIPRDSHLTSPARANTMAR